DRPIVVSYATSPAAEVIFAEEPLEDSPTANLACEGCAYRQVEAVGILAGTRARGAADRTDRRAGGATFFASVPEKGADAAGLGLCRGLGYG
ncbi:MAG: hypothetical protein FWJ61_11290, partial [Limnochordales bacterium]